MAKTKAIAKNDMVDSKAGKNSTALKKKPEDKSEVAKRKRLI